jgi:Tol biopolymer transport system component
MRQQSEVRTIQGEHMPPRWWPSIVAAALALVLITASIPVSAKVAPGNGPFERTWARTDRPVRDLAVERTWMWGFEANTPLLYEPYDQSPGGQRVVQYFDKSRMEITNPNAHDDGVWYVANGLLVVEMVEGYYQIGDLSDQRDHTPEPAIVNIAGDPGQRPSYADINQFALRTQPARIPGTTITHWFDDTGIHETGPVGVPESVTAAERVTVAGLDHTVASVFWAFMTSSATVYENGQLTTGNLFENAYYATGFPITEAYWSMIEVARIPRLVLWQCFERRCLTYTPDNGAGWQVEAGNVGQHYYTWRYASPSEPDRIVFSSNHTGNWDIVTTDSSGSRVTNLTSSDDAETVFKVAPNGTRIAFVRDYQRTAVRSYGDIYVMDIDGSAVSNLTDTSSSSTPLVTSGMDFAWSPDSQMLAYSCQRCPDPWTALYVMDADGSGVRRLNLPDGGGWVTDLAWSPDGRTIAFTYRREHETADIYSIRLDGSAPITNLTDHPATDSQPAWSPDGTMIAYYSTQDGAGGDLFVMRADGSSVTNLTRSGRAIDDITWSPDGSQIAYTVYQSAHSAIFVTDAAGTSPRQLTGDAAGVLPDRYVGDSSPAWSSDGQRLAFVSYRDGNAEIYVMQSDGTQQQRLTIDVSLDRDPVWLP